MPKRRSLLSVIQDTVRREVAQVMQTLLAVAEPKTKRRKKTKNGRRKRRGPGRPRGSKNKGA